MRLTRRNLLAAAAASPLAGMGTAAPAAAPLPALVAPQAAGFDPAPLKALSDDLQGLVDRGQLAGVTTLAARKGKVFHFETRGLADVETGAPARPDTIWRIASMTKPVVGVAMMQLWEKGLWKLDDPVARHIPEFAGLKVKAPDGSLVPQASPMTMAQLMGHTAGFHVPAEKAPRVARIHTYKDGRIVAGPPQVIPVTPPVFLSGGGGLLSTAGDYFRFSQALLDGGALEGVRILKPETVRLMRRSVLAPGVKVDLYGPSQAGVGFGLDFAVIEDPAAAATPQGKDTFYWGGAFGTWFWIDPTNDVVFVGMIQNLNGSIPGAGTPNLREITPRRLYAALRERAA